MGQQQVGCDCPTRFLIEMLAGGLAVTLVRDCGTAVCIVGLQPEETASLGAAVAAIVRERGPASILVTDRLSGRLAVWEVVFREHQGGQPSWLLQILLRPEQVRQLARQGQNVWVEAVRACDRLAARSPERERVN